MFVYKRGMCLLSYQQQEKSMEAVRRDGTSQEHNFRKLAISMADSFEGYRGWTRMY